MAESALCQHHFRTQWLSVLGERRRSQAGVIDYKVFPKGSCVELLVLSCWHCFEIFENFGKWGHVSVLSLSLCFLAMVS